MHSKEQIKSPGWKELVKKRPEMYFGTNGPSPQAICSAIGEGALILGADSVTIKKINQFWFIAANLDWLYADSMTGKKGIEIFESFINFPEAGQNSLRFECMAYLFSKTLATHCEGDSILIKGSEDNLAQFEKCLQELGLQGRVVGFEFSEST